MGVVVGVAGGRLQVVDARFENWGAPGCGSRVARFASLWDNVLFLLSPYVCYSWDGIATPSRTDEMKWCARRLQWRRGQLAGAVLNTDINAAFDTIRNCRRSRPCADGEIAGPLREMMVIFGINTQCHSRFISLSATWPRPPRDKRLAICVKPMGRKFCVFLQPARVPRKLGAPQEPTASAH